MSNFEHIKEQINKTGFVLEYNICSILEKNKWSIISNRYYIDDLKGMDREIDILAYKTGIIDNIRYYTTLIISCKKSESKDWVFLTKDLKQSDPNIKFMPILNWSNDKITNFMLSEVKTEERIFKSMKKNLSLQSVFGVNKQVFAFQELDKTKGSPQNDKPIYESITTTIKAFEYEKNSLGKRKKDVVFYNFNLLSIFDGEMLEMYFDNTDQVVQKIDEIKYLNRHIINQKEDFYRVHFIKATEFEKQLNHYEELYKWNLDNYSSLINEYYQNVMKNYNNKGLQLFQKELKNEILWYVNYKLELSGRLLDSLGLTYNDAEEKLMIEISSDKMNHKEEEEIVQLANQSEQIRKNVTEALHKIYRYEGEFEFTRFDLPF